MPHWLSVDVSALATGVVAGYAPPGEIPNGFSGISAWKTKEIVGFAGVSGTIRANLQGDKFSVQLPKGSRGVLGTYS